MIIQCPKCLTKFRLDDARVNDAGTRVRCSKCREVFVVEKEDAPSSGSPPTAEIKEEGTGDPAWSSISDVEAGVPSPESEEAKPATEETIHETEWPAASGYKAEETGIEKAAVKEPSLEGPPTTEDIKERPFATSGQEESQKKAVSEGRRSFLKIIASIIVICAAAAVPVRYLWINYKTAETGEIALADISGYYTQNAEAGNLFVVTGRVVNNTNKARSFFQIKGTLFGKNGETLLQKEVYCGNIFSSKEIATLPKDKIEADLRNRAGGSLSNVNLLPGKAVPFIIVFFDLPKDLAEFSVEVSGSQAAFE